MAGNQFVDKEKLKQPSAIDLALARHESEDGIDTLEFESDPDIMEQEQEMLYNYVKNRSMSKNSNRVLFKINNRPIFGSNGQKISGGAVPLFIGAAIDLSSINATGEKKFLKEPQATGRGGILAIMPQKFNQGLTLPFDKITLKQNYIDGNVLLNNKVGFHGKHILLTAEKMHITMDKAEFINPKLVYRTKDDESIVPVPEKIYIDKSGFSSGSIASALRISAPEKAPEKAPEETFLEETENIQLSETETENIQTETENTQTVQAESIQAETEETKTEETQDSKTENESAQTETENTQKENETAQEETVQQAPETVEEILDEETKSQEPDRIIMQVGKGRFCSKIRKVPMDFYDGFIVKRVDGNLIAIVKTGGKEVVLELNETDEYHKYTAHSISVSTKDRPGLLEGILTEFGLKKVGSDETEVCYRKLELTEDGIFFSSLRDTNSTLSVKEDWEVKIGNTLGLNFSNDFIKDKKDNDGSYYDLARKVLEHFGVIKSNDDEDKQESEEDAEDGGNRYHYTVSFLTFPIIPGLVSVDAKFDAGAKMGYKVGGSINNIAGAFKRQQAEETFGFDLEGSLTGAAYAGIKAGITAGPSNVLNLSANLGAKIALTGGDNDKIFTGKVHTEFNKNRKGKPHFKKAELDFLGSLYLKALLEGSIDAQILGWEKTLYSYTFKEWEIGAIEAEIKAIKESGQKWKGDASLSFRGLSGRIKSMLESGNTMEKMFKKQEESYGTKAFDASQSSFEDAKRILMEYSNKRKSVFINTKETGGAQSGFLDMNNAIKDIQHRFYLQLMTNRETISIEVDELNKLQRDKTYNALGQQIQSKINKHSANIASIEKALSELKTKSSSKSPTATTPAASTAKQPNENASAPKTETNSEKIMQAYITGGGNRDKFLSHLKKKAKHESVTVNALLAYEESRRAELSAKSEERIKKMREYAQSIGIADSDVTRGNDLLNKYKSLGGKAVKQSQFSTIEDLRKYEEARLAQKHTSKVSREGKKFRSHTERLDKLAEVFPQIVKNGSDVPNLEFYKYYTETLKAKKFSNSLDIYSNRERLLAYERSVFASKIEGDEKGKEAFEKRTLLRKLVQNESRSDIENLLLNGLMLNGFEAMRNDKKTAYMIAGNDDFISALEQSDKVKALKLLIAQKKEESKTDKHNKGKQWLYNMIKENIRIEDLIDYEKKRFEQLGIRSSRSKKHKERLDILINAVAEYNKATSTNSVNGEEAQKILYDAMQEYFNFDQKNGKRREGFLDDLEKRIDEGDPTVWKYFEGTGLEPDESKEISKLRNSETNIYNQIRFYGKKKGSKVVHKQNRKLLLKHMKKSDKREYTIEDLDRYYSYKIHRAAAADHHADHRADHATILDTLEKITDYPEMLRVYKEMGRGDSFIEHEKKEAGNWVTPNMILGYERSRIYMIDQKHLERIEALDEAKTGTQEEQAEAIKEYGESATRFDKKANVEGLKISLNDIINAEQLRQDAKMLVHDKRIELLKSTEDGKTDEDKIKAYEGTRFKASKEETERIYAQIEEKIASNPEAMAEELKSFETSQKEIQEEQYNKWKELEKNITEKIVLLTEQAVQCSKVLNDTENVLKNPESVFKNESDTKDYIDNVLDKTQDDMTKVPEVINMTSK